MQEVEKFSSKAFGFTSKMRSPPLCHIEIKSALDVEAAKEEVDPSQNVHFSRLT